MKRYIIYIILLALVEISLSLYLTEWRSYFWDYVQQKNFHGFCYQIGVFTGVALLFCFVNAWAGYYTTRCAIKWREVLNTKALQLYNTKSADHSVENYNQRIEADCREYPDLMLNVLFGFGKAVVYVVVFSVSLVINFSFIYLAIIISYATISTLIAKRIATPLLSLNYATQQAEATYRNNLTIFNFTNCIQIMQNLALKTKCLAYFQTFYGQIAVILPIVIVSPAYFGSALTLGALMQATGTMGTITENLSFGITSFNQINRLASCKRRLKEINVL